VINGSGAFRQTAVVPEMVAVGRSLMVMVTLPLGDPAQTVLLTSTTPVRLYTKVPGVVVGISNTAVAEFDKVLAVKEVPPLILYVNV
jgi:hypothetical protein